MELIKPQKQKVWKWPAVVNFTCGGIGTGYFLLGLLVTLPHDGDWLALALQSNGAWLSLALLTAVVKLLGPVLVAIGFTALTTEAGRPQRGINLFRHLSRSWMSRETLAFAVFAPFAAFDWIFPTPIARLVAALGALALMISQGFIVYRARGVTAWNVSLIPIFFVSSGFATASGLLFVVMMLFGMLTQPLMPVWIVIALVAWVANAFVWLAYLNRSGKPFRDATLRLRSVNYHLAIVGLGHALPTLLLLGVLVGFAASSPIFVVAGLLAMFGGALQKWGIVMDAGYLRAITLSVPMSITQRFASSQQSEIS